MIPAPELALFALAALIMVLTPGPNMVYLVSRSLCQGRQAGVISLMGVATGFLVHMFAAAAGITAVFMAIPLAYETLKWLGAAYLLWLAWQAIRPGAKSPFERGPFEARQLPPDSPARLFFMGFMTNALNPKIAVFYLSVFPQFLRPEHGSVFSQGITLGLTQIAISFAVNLLIILGAARLAAWFARNPLWLGVQRWFMGCVLGGLAVRLALEERRN
jgi:threonine/homoserine/homoserine lactone efflux protein